MVYISFINENGSFPEFQAFLRWSNSAYYQLLPHVLNLQLQSTIRPTQGYGSKFCARAQFREKHILSNK